MYLCTRERERGSETFRVFHLLIHHSPITGHISTNPSLSDLKKKRRIQQLHSLWFVTGEREEGREKKQEVRNDMILLSVAFLSTYNINIYIYTARVPHSTTIAASPRLTLIIIFPHFRRRVSGLILQKYASRNMDFNNHSSQKEIFFLR